MRIHRAGNKWSILCPSLAGSSCLRELARRCGYRVCQICHELECSERYFRRVFVRDTGLSPKQWLRDERMLIARQKLDEGTAPWEVALALGFSSHATFRREFREVYGTLPGRWKAEMEQRISMARS